MKRIFFIALLVVFFSDAFSQSKNELVRNCFQDYKNAILEDRGNDAANLVSKRTIEYYEKMLDVSLNADSIQVSELNVLDQLTVFTVRHKIPKSDISELTGKEFFIYAINHGMVGKNSVMNVEIGEVKVDNSFATGQLVNKGQPAPIYFHFYDEDGWKLDLTSIFPVSIATLNSVTEASEIDQSEYIFIVLETLTGKYPDENIWHPMKEVSVDNAINEEAKNLIGIYKVESYPVPDALNWEVELKEDFTGYQKSYYDNCSQSELKFKWQYENGVIIFSESFLRERFACDELWGQWKVESMEADPYDLKVLDDSSFVLKSQVDEYQEKWIRIK